MGRHFPKKKKTEKTKKLAKRSVDCIHNKWLYKFGVRIYFTSVRSLMFCCGINVSEGLRGGGFGGRCLSEEGEKVGAVSGLFWRIYHIRVKRICHFRRKKVKLHYVDMRDSFFSGYAGDVTNIFLWQFCSQYGIIMIYYLFLL